MTVFLQKINILSQNCTSKRWFAKLCKEGENIKSLTKANDKQHKIALLKIQFQELDRRFLQ